MSKVIIIISGFCILLNCYVDSSSTIFKEPIAPETVEKMEKCDFSSYKPIIISHYVQFWVVSKFKPKYPEEAFRRNIQGEIRVKIIVDQKGNVVAACALSGDKILREVSEKVAKRWKFKDKGGKYYVRAQLSFLFKIESKKDTDSKGKVYF